MTRANRETRKWFVAFLLVLGTSSIIVAQDRFIDGFPDVPYLDIISTILGDPVMFDTPSGTVAEVSIQFDATPATVLQDYGTAMAGLGWTCSKTATRLDCLRDAAIVELKLDGAEQASSTFILRLEPRQ